MTSPPCSRISNASAVEASGVTAEISAPAGISPVATRSTACSKSHRSYTRAPITLSSRQKTRKRSTGLGSSWIATTTRRPRTASAWIAAARPASAPDTSNATCAPAPSVQSSIAWSKRDRAGRACAVPAARRSHGGARPARMTTTSAPSAAATNAISRPIGPPPTTSAPRRPSSRSGGRRARRRPRARRAPRGRDAGSRANEPGARRDRPRLLHRPR